MARLFDDASTQYLALSQALTSPPFTIACWARSDDNTVIQGAVVISNAGLGAQYHGLFMDGSAGGDPVKAITANAGTSGVASTSTGYSTNTWHHICGVWAASNSRASYIDGGSKGTNTTNVTPTTPDTTSIGRRTASASDMYFSGRLAQIVVWNEALTDDEVALMAQLKAPPWAVRPWAIKGFVPVDGFQSPEIDLAVPTQRWTVTGATPIEHASHIPIFPARQLLVPIWA